MSRLRWALAALLAPLVTTGVPAFEGTVVLPDGTPAADATISIVGRAGATRTDAQGRFTWAPDPPVPFQIVVVLAGGVTTLPARVDRIPPDAPVVVIAHPAGTEAISVTAEAAPHIEAPPASGLTMLSAEDLEQRRPARLTDAIENIPGTGRLGSGHDAVPSIRGLARGRTLILLDGHRVTTERRAGPSAAFLDPFFLEAIELSRGPGAVAYGSDAFGGIIHARTPQARPAEPLKVRFTGSWGAGVPQRAAGAELSRGLPQGGVLFQARMRQFPEDYRSPEGDVPDSEGLDYGVLARLDQEVGAGSLALSWQSDVGRDIEEPSSVSGEVRTTRPREHSHRLGFAWRLDPLADATLVTLSGFAGEHRLVTERDRFATTALPRVLEVSDIRAKDFGLRALMVRPMKRWRLESGLDINGRRGLEATGHRNFVEQVSIEDAERLDAGLYAALEAPLGSRLSLSAGARADRVSSRNRGGLLGDGDTRDAALSGHAALTAGPWGGLTFTGQISRGFRDPTLSDRYFAGISGRGFVTGNPDLEPEKSLQLDAVVRSAHGKVRWALYAYHYRIDDLVERFASGTDPGTGDDLFFFRNLGKATLRGVEMEVDGAIGDWFSWELTAQAARGTGGDREDLADVPVDNAVLQVRRMIGERGHLYARAAAFARDDRPGPTEQETPGHATLDLGGGWRPQADLELRLILRNVLDATYPASTDENAPPAAGRSVLLTLVGSLRTPSARSTSP